MADNFVKDLSGLTPAQLKTIEANAAGALVAAKKNAEGVITEYRSMTPEEYLASRGGVNTVTGKFGDSASPYDLTNEQYLAALSGKTGTDRGKAINAATAQNQYNYLISQGYDPTKAAEYSGWSPTGGYTGTSGGGSSSASTDYLARQQASYQAGVDKAARQSAYDLLYAQFKQYGLESLVEGIKGLIQENVSPSEFSIRLQDTDAYKKRFAANQDRIKAGLAALTPAEYIGLEDQYQNIMRNYGLPASYYTKDAMGTQAGFNKFIANDVSAAELEDRISTAVQRVNNADVNVKDALRRFYPNITDGDILAYTLDPTNALNDIKRKVTAAEIGGAALGQGLATGVARAEELAQYGVTKAKAQEGYGTIGEFLPTAEKLGDIYANQGLGAYDQATAEAEVFGTAGAAEAAKKRKKLSALEQAQFGGQAGTSQGALDRGRQGAF